MFDSYSKDHARRKDETNKAAVVAYLLVSVLVVISDNMSLNPSEAYNSFYCLKNEKEAGDIEHCKRV